jgi:hypothetical protein
MELRELFCFAYVEGEEFSKRVSTAGGSEVPELEQALEGKSDAERVDVLLDWLAGRRLNRVIFDGGDRKTVCRVLERLRPPSVLLQWVEPWKEWLDDLAAACPELSDLAVQEHEAPRFGPAIAKLGALSSLSLEVGLDLEVGPLRAAKGLETVTIRSESEVRGLDALGKLPALKSVELTTQGTLSVAALRGAPLTTLKLGAATLSDVDAAGSFTALAELDLGNASSGTVDLSPLRELEVLRLVGVAVKGAAPRVKQAILNMPLPELSVVATWTALEKLWYYGAPKGADLAPLASLPALRALALGDDYKPTAKQLAPLAGKKGLKVSSALGDDLAIAKLVKKAPSEKAEKARTGSSARSARPGTGKRR